MIKIKSYLKKKAHFFFALPSKGCKSVQKKWIPGRFFQQESTKNKAQGFVWQGGLPPLPQISCQNRGFMELCALPSERESMPHKTFNYSNHKLNKQLTNFLKHYKFLKIQHSTKKIILTGELGSVSRSNTKITSSTNPPAFHSVLTPSPLFTYPGGVSSYPLNPPTGGGRGVHYPFTWGFAPSLGVRSCKAKGVCPTNPFGVSKGGVKNGGVSNVGTARPLFTLFTPTKCRETECLSPLGGLAKGDNLTQPVKRAGITGDLACVSAFNQPVHSPFTPNPCRYKKRIQRLGAGLALGQNGKSKDVANYFLLSKITNKSFLCYWLLPVIGLALITKGQGFFSTAMPSSLEGMQCKTSYQPFSYFTSITSETGTRTKSGLQNIGLSETKTQPELLASSTELRSVGKALPTFSQLRWEQARVCTLFPSSNFPANGGISNAIKDWLGTAGTSKFMLKGNKQRNNSTIKKSITKKQNGLYSSQQVIRGGLTPHSILAKGSGSILASNYYLTNFKIMPIQSQIVLKKNIDFVSLNRLNFNCKMADPFYGAALTDYSLNKGSSIKSFVPNNPLYDPSNLLGALPQEGVRIYEGLPFLPSLPQLYPLWGFSAVPRRGKKQSEGQRGLGGIKVCWGDKLTQQVKRAGINNEQALKLVTSSIKNLTLGEQSNYKNPPKKKGGSSHEMSNFIKLYFRLFPKSLCTYPEAVSRSEGSKLSSNSSPVTNLRFVTENAVLIPLCFATSNPFTCYPLPPKGVCPKGNGITSLGVSIPLSGVRGIKGPSHKPPTREGVGVKGSGKNGWYRWYSEAMRLQDKPHYATLALNFNNPTKTFLMNFIESSASRNQKPFNYVMVFPLYQKNGDKGKTKPHLTNKSINIKELFIKPNFNQAALRYLFLNSKPLIQNTVLYKASTVLTPFYPLYNPPYPLRGYAYPEGVSSNPLNPQGGVRGVHYPFTWGFAPSLGVRSCKAKGDSNFIPFTPVGGLGDLVQYPSPPKGVCPEGKGVRNEVLIPQRGISVGGKYNCNLFSSPLEVNGKEGIHYKTIKQEKGNNDLKFTTLNNQTTPIRSVLLTPASNYFKYINNKLKRFIITRPTTVKTFPRVIPYAAHNLTNLRSATLGEGKGSVSSVSIVSVADRADNADNSLAGVSMLTDGKATPSKLNSANPSISILLKHKKMFKKINSNLYIGEQTKSKQILDSRLYFQKKRKAKKQRLETRRQKKRTRLFPRPAWIRFRMFSDFLHTRYAGNLTLYPLTSNPRGITSPGKGGMGQNPKKRTPKANRVLTPPLLTCYPRMGISKAPSNNALSPSLTDLGLLVCPKGKGGLRGSNPFFSPEGGSLDFVWVKRDLVQGEVGLAKEVFDIYNSLIYELKSFTSKHNMPSNALNKSIVSSVSIVSVADRADNALSPYGGLREQIQSFKKIKETKLKANYINFKSQKQNNQSIIETNTISTMFRDFWIWVYNITSNNKANHVIFSKNQTPLCWALNKTFNKYSFTQYNKRYTLWGSQKIRNQSKNNKTVLMSKQLVTYWDRFFLNKNLNLFNKKIYTKMRNSLQKVNYLNNIEMKKNTSRNKVTLNKEGGLKLIPALAGSNPLKGDGKKGNNSFTELHSLKKRKEISRQRQTFHRFGQNTVFLKDSNYYKYNLLVNLPWWYELNITPFKQAINFLNNVKYSPDLQKIEVTNPPLLTDLRSVSNGSGAQPQVKRGKGDKGLGNIKPLNSQRPGISKHRINSTLNFLEPLAVCSTILFHFCALISLISISQLRCFLKFHLILVYKISNLYSLLITQISHAASSLLFVKKGRGWLGLPTAGWQTQPLLPNNKKLIPQRGISNGEKFTPLLSNFSPLTRGKAPSMPVVIPYGECNEVAKQRGQHTNRPRSVSEGSGAQPQVKRHKGEGGKGFNAGVKVKRGKVTGVTQPPQPELSSGYLSETGIKELGKKVGEVELELSLSLNLVRKQFIKVSQPRFKNNVFSFKLLDKKSSTSSSPSPFYNPPKLGAKPQVRGDSNFIPVTPSYPNEVLIPQRGISEGEKKLKITPFLKAKKAYTSKNFLSYKINSIHLFFKKDINRIGVSTKNQGLKTIFKLIDLVQSTLRSISAFFEKPAEFTTSWIAYGFLVEWSSDFLAIIPENADIYMWNTFSKVSRILPISNLSLFAFPLKYFIPPLLTDRRSVIPLLGQSPSLGDNYLPLRGQHTPSGGEGVRTLFGLAKGKAVLGLQLTSTVSFFTISLLLQRRMAYLFDSLIKTVSQPDADLIRRQQKGTLFWDIWADFLVTAADQYNVNIAALSTIKVEQNNLIENISNAGNLYIGFNSQSRKALANLGVASFPSFTCSPSGTTSKEHSPKAKGKGLQQSCRELALTRSSSLNPFLPSPFALPLHSVWVKKVKRGLEPAPASSYPLRGGKKRAVISSNLFGVNKGGKREINKAQQVKREGIRTTNPSSHPGKLSNDSLVKESLITWNNLATTSRWEVNQFITYQSWNNNSDLFIDHHPPKSFTHMPIIKYNNTIQQPIGTLVCQIYAGIFNKQISKNILLVNNKNNAVSGRASQSSNPPSGDKRGKSTSNIQSQVNYNALLIQALAGETELKIITDNAKRYALVNRGFAIGIKLLRDVFDKIKLTTPCIFLLEDIHAIGEKRPMLISDYGGDDTKTNNELFMSQLDEVHEKNQVIYQNFFHAITHYKKPFKGDYSTAIPTNKYLTDLYRFLRAQATNNLSLTVNNNTTIKPKIEASLATKDASLQNKKGSSLSFATHRLLPLTSNPLGGITSLGQIPIEQSPFNVLLVKDSPKELQNKIVQEFPWTGLPGEQLSTKPRISYSVRAKVSMLAELSLSNLSAKLDMITDLLVIIDSVRGNKGFVVFATTDVPHVLDPALRRPGRLDETICMPNISNTSVLSGNSRYEIFKSVNNFDSNYKSQADSLHYLQRSPLIFTPYPFRGKKCRGGANLTINLNDSLSYCANNSNVTLNYALLSKSMFLLTTLAQKSTNNTIKNSNPFAKGDRNFIPFTSNPLGGITSLGNLVQGKGKADENNDKLLLKLKLLALIPRRGIKALAYYEVSKAVLNFKIQTTSSVNTFNTLTQTFKSGGSSQSAAHINYLAMFGEGPYVHLSQQIMLLFAGKMGQNLASKRKKLPILAQTHIVTKKHRLSLNPLLGAKPQLGKVTDRLQSTHAIEDQDLQLATTLMLAFIQKRYLYHKNLIVPKLLSFLDGQVLDEPPSPPFSNLLIPAKRFENYKRVFRDSIFADNIGIYTNRKTIDYYEKMQDQIQLSSIKKLGSSVKLKTNNLGSSTYNLETNFLKKLYHLKSLQTSTNINWYYQNRILKRHSQYLINQWWNGQLSEHNAETVFLSDIDWRSSFIKSSFTQGTKGKVSGQGLGAKPLSPSSHTVGGLEGEKGQDVLLDFPDADQIYNPRRRRWLLNKGYWGFWFNFEKIYSEQLVHHLVLECVIKTYTYLYNNGELLDYITAKFITLGSAKYNLRYAGTTQIGLPLNLHSFGDLGDLGEGAIASPKLVIPPGGLLVKGNKNLSILKDNAVIPDSIKEIHLTHSFTRF